ncbi:MAG: polysaccharide deacetylase [Streptosporangiaceae bacterium]|jgi:peptidoglycan/xylan/chitin deacetylase (PgdA/CDA1 family)|nr:polysaccharide deacetylase [Streptosporangiaceae bacterium]
MDLGTEMSRRKALGLGALGVAGVTFTGSALLRGDGGHTASSRLVPHPAARVPAPRVSSSPTPRATPLPPSPTPVPVRDTPVFKIHDILPDAPPDAIALTIDDGPSPEWTPKVLKLLDEQKVKATFCVIGIEVQESPELLREIVAAGHQVANHTMHHPISLARLSARGIEAEISDAHRHIQDVTGTTPRLFRAPGGNWSHGVLKSVAKHGMLPIDWDVDPRDWSRPGTDHITRTLLRGKAGDILLCHDGGGNRSQTLSSLRTVIPRLKDRGLEFIAL